MKKTIKGIAFVALVLGSYEGLQAQSYRYIEDGRGIIIKANSDGSNHQEHVLLNVGIPGGGGGHITALRAKHNEVVLEKRTIVNGEIISNQNLSVSKYKSLYAANLRSNASNSEINAHNKLYAVKGLRLSGSSSSRLGIGTSSPQTSIHLTTGSIRVDGGQYQSHGPVALHPDVDKNGDDIIAFMNSDNQESARIHDGRLRLNTINGVGSEIHSTGGLILRPDIENNGGDDFVSFRNTSGQEKTRIQDGTITTDRVVLNVGSFPDYVFEEDYNLMPLSEIADYIKTNKHLPNMPSEAEVVKNGMSLGQINTVLVEKVEELTLHTISQEEKLSALLKYIEKQEATMAQMQREIEELKIK